MHAPSNGAVASASSIFSSDYLPSGAVDGETAGVNWTHGGGWADGTIDTYPDWLEVDFSGTRTIDHAVIYTVQDDYAHSVEPTDTMTFTQYGIVDFTFQAWDGQQWVTLATVTGNNLVKRTLSFTAFTTSKVRVNVTRANDVARITEVETYGW